MTEKELKTAFENGVGVVCNTPEEYDSFAGIVEEWGYVWAYGIEKPTEWSPFKVGWQNPSAPINAKGTHLVRTVSCSEKINFSDVELESASTKTKIIILSDGELTTAKLIEGKNAVKEVSVKRNHKDAPSLKVAYEELGKKLFAEEVTTYDGYKVVKRKAVKGDYVILLGKRPWVHNYENAKKGDIIYMDGSEQSPDSDGYIWGVGASFALDEYLVLVDYKPKPKFKPYLIRVCTGTKYGAIGDKTNIQDLEANTLYVGDTVNLRCNGKLYGEYSVCRDDTGIMSVAGMVFKFGVSGNWTIRKKRSYAEIKHGETVDNDITYVLKE